MKIKLNLDKILDCMNFVATDPSDPRINLQGIHIYDFKGYRFYESTNGNMLYRTKEEIETNQKISYIVIFKKGIKKQLKELTEKECIGHLDFLLVEDEILDYEQKKYKIHALVNIKNSLSFKILTEENFPDTSKILKTKDVNLNKKLKKTDCFFQTRTENYKKIDSVNAEHLPWEPYSEDPKDPSCVQFFKFTKDSLLCIQPLCF